MTKPTLIILAHPDLSESQINASWYAKLIEQAPCLRFHDLYRTYPHWNIDVAAEQALLEQHERIIFQFPMYWYSVPPMRPPIIPMAPIPTPSTSAAAMPANS